MRNLLTLAIVTFANFCIMAEEPAISVFSTPHEVGEVCARKIADLIIERQKEGKPCVLGLATGSTPIPVYTALKKIVREYHLDLSHVITFNLDEYVGLPASHSQSYQSFMFAHLFDELLSSDENPHGIRRENIHLPPGDMGALTQDELEALLQQFPDRNSELSQEELQWIAKRRAAEYDALIAELGPIDLQILGIGRNGHIGFAEPGTEFSTRTMIVELTEMTRKDNARFFNDDLQAVPSHAISMGIATTLGAKEIVLLATGEPKAEIIVKTLSEAISSDIPSTALRLGPR